ncbi:DUF421 domain-containing protein [Halalkalibacterium halodurans]|uniref:BH1232 protein n=1 Tax=Halalkalibacterium halodurans (strain ATCC BAA-125 / DSM 18197 / FERM 7344 / JCM 9153 / C-125) TaxID=272558 RepID=Q9KDI1_HALH5|nr:DUF421 domain-containing protein [Halalkalibacterium halodurans]MDY7221755.1 DUF421 domain-containing protein [Halalkalibacterium halodurans]MDY7241031.1 DUF421 domain-containing protein [Halalkalibacterium halodurans]MED3645556.1 DUF421 domain-containing protein [Halalkalibacterium halodurans]MED4079429.1 DUF421 domain-containing protein [Halalkalibacterium halodurans]MED4086549.1 DUF421 domain-containing protein [Halalkalibacterium halodurans]
MEYPTIILRTILIYFIILLVLRIMGKREIGQLSVLDFVVSIMIAELAVISIENIQVSMMNTIIPIVVLSLIQIVFAYVSLKSKTMRRLVDGKPTVLISQGKIDEREMRKQRYNFDDLLIQLRQSNVRDISDVEFAILEPSGKLSVIEKRPFSGKSSSYLPLPLILDGKVQEKHLEKINKTSLWLRQQLRKLGYRDIKKISYCAIKEDGTFFIDIKDEK